MDIEAPARHSLVMYQSDAVRRSRTAAWVADALARGDKVLHSAGDATELTGDLGTPARAALDSGGLEVVDPHICHQETDGLHWALRQLFEDMVRVAFDAGHPGVLLTHGAGALRVMAPEPAERLAYEHDLERLTALPGVRALCCYDLRTEQTDLLDAVAGLHHRAVEDVLWSARVAGDRLLVHGEIDAANAGRFGAVLRVAASHGLGVVDLAGVSVLSAAGLRVFEGAADLLARRGERLRLVGTSPALFQALTAVHGAAESWAEPAPAGEADGR
ncbi:MAG TPA: MEDS domain-containing protein [Actinophytocola sp.]|nr:MEDS domain-containing protein [Actinophytocola sp.]